MSQLPIRIVIVDNHLVVCAALKMLIENEPHMKVVGQAINRQQALTIAESERPDVILLDLDLGDENGLDVLSGLSQAFPGVRVLVLTGLRDVESHRGAARLGAAGVVLKEQPANVLLKAIERVHAGELWLDRSTVGSLFHEMTHAPKIDPEATKIAGLTRREREVATLVAEGLKNRDIAARLFISETTVTHHLSSVFSKLGVTDRLELVIYAFANNLAKTP